MARTRDFLDEWAEWYSLPETSTTAGAAAPALPSRFAPLPRSGSSWSTAQSGLAAILQALLAWHDRARQRRGLLQLSDHMLRDVGLSRAEARCEAAKPFWRG